jgi:pimeloyl-ACP methyl ester carboxylesterase
LCQEGPLAYLPIGPGRIYYSGNGEADGMPVVFIHGAGGSRLNWGRQLGALASLLRVLALTYRAMAGPAGLR